MKNPGKHDPPWAGGNLPESPMPSAQITLGVLPGAASTLEHPKRWIAWAIGLGFGIVSVVGVMWWLGRDPRENKVDPIASPKESTTIQTPARPPTARPPSIPRAEAIPPPEKTPHESPAVSVSPGRESEGAPSPKRPPARSKAAPVPTGGPTELERALHRARELGGTDR